MICEITLFWTICVVQPAIVLKETYLFCEPKQNKETICFLYYTAQMVKFRKIFVLFTKAHSCIRFLFGVGLVTSALFHLWGLRFEQVILCWLLLTGKNLYILNHPISLHYILCLIHSFILFFVFSSSFVLKLITRTLNKHIFYIFVLSCSLIRFILSLSSLWLLFIFFILLSK